MYFENIPRKAPHQQIVKIMLCQHLNYIFKKAMFKHCFMLIAKDKSCLKKFHIS